MVPAPCITVYQPSFPCWIKILPFHIVYYMVMFTEIYFWALSAVPGIFLILRNSYATMYFLYYSGKLLGIF